MFSRSRVFKVFCESSSLTIVLVDLMRLYLITYLINLDLHLLSNPPTSQMGSGMGSGIRKVALGSGMGSGIWNVTLGSGMGSGIWNVALGSGMSCCSEVESAM